MNSTMSNHYNDQVTSLLHDDSKEFGLNNPGRANSHDNVVKLQAVRTTAIGLGFFQLLLFVLYGVTQAEWLMVADSNVDPTLPDFSAAYSLFIVRNLSHICCSRIVDDCCYF
jgi:hypothetical protein